VLLTITPSIIHRHWTKPVSASGTGAMNNIFNQDFQDFIHALNNNQVRYLLVGGYSVILHGYSRSTGDMDIWVDKTVQNYQCLVKAFQEFRMAMFDMTESKFLLNADIDVFTFGQSPVCIDLMTSVKGLNFTEAYDHSQLINIERLEIRVISHSDLLIAKKAAGRARDLDDIEKLRKRKN
jgi:hypothetical protein